MIQLPRCLKTRYKIEQLLNPKHDLKGYLPKRKRPWNLNFTNINNGFSDVWFARREDALDYIREKIQEDHQKWGRRTERWTRFIEKLKAGTQGGWG